MFKPLFALAIILFFHTICFAQLQCDTIKWTETVSLKWADFRGDPDTSIAVKAKSAPQVGYSCINNGDTLFVDIYCRFLTCAAWTKSNNTVLLKHEQTHFDITEYFKRLFIQKLLSTRFEKKAPFDQLKNIYSQIIRERNDLDDEYDKQTDFSRNVTQQNLWSADLKMKINKLKPINRKRIIVYLKE